jgi:hypothetical protein
MTSSPTEREGVQASGLRSTVRAMHNLVSMQKASLSEGQAADVYGKSDIKLILSTNRMRMLSSRTENILNHDLVFFRGNRNSVRKLAETMRCLDHFEASWQPYYTHIVE